MGHENKTNPYLETMEAWEPVAAALREAGFDAWADDAGHANYGVFVKIGTPRIDVMLTGAAEGFGYNLTDPAGFLVDGNALADISSDSTPQQIADAIATVARELREGQTV